MKTKNKKTKKLLRTMLLLSALLTLMAMIPMAGAQSAAIVVNTMADELNDDGDCSLREAVQSANTGMMVDGCRGSASSATINVPAGVITLNGSQLMLSSNATLRGAGAETILDGGGASRILHVAAGATATPSTA